MVTSHYPVAVLRYNEYALVAMKNLLDFSELSKPSSILMSDQGSVVVDKMVYLVNKMFNFDRAVNIL